MCFRLNFFNLSICNSLKCFCNRCKHRNMTLFSRVPSHACSYFGTITYLTASIWGLLIWFSWFGLDPHRHRSPTYQRDRCCRLGCFYHPPTQAVHLFPRSIFAGGYFASLTHNTSISPSLFLSASLSGLIGLTCSSLPLLGTPISYSFASEFLHEVMISPYQSVCLNCCPFWWS